MCKTNPFCHYAGLEIEHDANASQIKTAFRSQSLVHHPDKLASRSAAERLVGEERMKAINNAHDTLGDAELRRRYDSALSTSTSPDTPLRRKGATPKKRKSSMSPNTAPKKKRKATHKPKGKRWTTPDHKHGYDCNGWRLDFTVSAKNIVIGNAQDVTTSKMHHICVSLAFDMELNEEYKAPQDGTKDSDMRLDLEATPGGRDITSVTLTPKELHLSASAERNVRTLTVTIMCPRKAPPLSKPIQTSFNFEPPVRPPLQARVCTTNTIYSREEPPANIREFTPSVLQPVYPRACPKSYITTLPEIKLADDVRFSIRWVNLEPVGGKYSVEECHGDAWHRMTAAGYRLIPGATDTS